MLLEPDLDASLVVSDISVKSNPLIAVETDLAWEGVEKYTSGYRILEPSRSRLQN